MKENLVFYLHIFLLCVWTIMKRSDQHVSLYTPSLSATTTSKFRETKKLRKRRELNAMVAPRHLVIRG